MQAHFGTAPMRWFDLQLPQEYIPLGSCVRVRRVSTIRMYVQRGLQPMSQPLFQFDVLDLDPETARDAAFDLIEFLGTVDLSSNAQFGCPATTPVHFPAFILNQRAGMEPIPDPPVFVQSIDARFFNLESN
jgi:hypothetical protein